MNKTTDSYKRLQAVIKDVNGDSRGILESLPPPCRSWWKYGKTLSLAIAIKMRGRKVWI